MADSEDRKSRQSGFHKLYSSLLYVPPDRLKANFTEIAEAATEEELLGPEMELDADAMADFIADLPVKERDRMIEELRKAALDPDDEIHDPFAERPEVRSRSFANVAPSERYQRLLQRSSEEVNEE
ncbi:MAG: hypothetical protein HQL50_01235 [Magnetococcales bacterium]|nr:hypothetical protein [Magnetococcales bacterium]